MLLASFSHDASSMPSLAEELLQSPLTEREQASIEEYVVQAINPEALPVDSRWATSREISRLQLIQAGGGIGAQVRELQTMLAQLGMDLKIQTPQDLSQSINAAMNRYKDLEPGTTEPYKLETTIGVGTPTSLKVDQNTYEIMILPATARPNLNLLSRDALERYLKYLHLSDNAAKDLADVISDWRGLSISAGAATVASNWYTSRSEPYARPRADIKSWGELMYLYGSDSALMDFLRDHFVLHGSGLLDVRYLPSADIAAILDLEPAVAAKGVDYFLHPDPNNPDRALEDVIGVDNANLFSKAITNRTTESEPLIVTVKSATRTSVFVIDPKTKVTLERISG
jgi:hypothetical protein